MSEEEIQCFKMLWEGIEFWKAMGYGVLWFLAWIALKSLYKGLAVGWEKLTDARDRWLYKGE